ncbi:recombinase RecT [Cupriavidus oxalaticus]|uniref:recombinase RecT n=1 Tax=Cupriavidus oxalaticus TaxID=96344 RepID=UPI00317025E2
MTALTTTQHFDLSPRSLEEAMKFADVLADSSIVPKDFMGKPGNVLVAIQWGMELGLKPLQAMQNIAVINGRPALWGDAVIALVRSSPLCEYVHESLSEDGSTAICQVKRRGEGEQVRTFSMADAKTAGLTGKQGPWSQYPKRMLQMRARAFALRDVFPDVLKGMPIAEEIGDYPTEKDITPARQTPAQIATAALPQPAERDDRLNTIIADLEFIAQEGGAGSLADAWGGKTKLPCGVQMTVVERKALGSGELDRLKLMTGEEEPQAGEQQQQPEEQSHG